MIINMCPIILGKKLNTHTLVFKNVVVVFLSFICSVFLATFENQQMESRVRRSRTQRKQSNY